MPYDVAQVAARQKGEGTRHHAGTHLQVDQGFAMACIPKRSLCNGACLYDLFTHAHDLLVERSS